MVKFTAHDLRKIMDKKDNIRNVSVIGHYHHGKTTLTNTLVAAAGIAGNVRMTDTHADEAKRGFSIKSTGISLYYKYNDENLKRFDGERNGNEYLINLIDSPGHVDFLAEVTAALRITDGAPVVVDCIEGVCLQTKTVLRLALGEQIRPVLILNKMDRCFLEFKVDDEEAYQIFQKVINDANDIIDTYYDPHFADVKFSPEKGNVAFSAGLHGWAFTLKHFAKMHADKYKGDESEMMKMLWGDNFYDMKTREWTQHKTRDDTCKRGFVRFCYDPIKQIIDNCMMNDNDKGMKKFLQGRLTDLGLKDLGATITKDKELTGKPLMLRIMQTWLPAAMALLEIMIFHLPSPRTPQIYRVEKLYGGPLDDAYAKAIRECDPNGSLMLYVSKMFPTSDKASRFFAFGRVFACSVSKGMKVKIMGPNFKHGEKQDLYVHSVQKIVIWMGNNQLPVEDVPCGNTVAMAYLDEFIQWTPV